MYSTGVFRLVDSTGVFRLVDKIDYVNFELFSIQSSISKDSIELIKLYFKVLGDNFSGIWYIYFKRFNLNLHVI